MAAVVLPPRRDISSPRRVAGLYRSVGASLPSRRRVRCRSRRLKRTPTRRRRSGPLRRRPQPVLRRFRPFRFMPRCSIVPSWRCHRGPIVTRPPPHTPPPRGRLGVATSLRRRARELSCLRYACSPAGRVRGHDQAEPWRVARVLASTLRHAPSLPHTRRATWQTFTARQSFVKRDAGRRQVAVRRDLGSRTRACRPAGDRQACRSSRSGARWSLGRGFALFLRLVPG